MPPSYTDDSQFNQGYAKYAYPPQVAPRPDPRRNQHHYSTVPSLYYAPHALQGAASMPIPPPPPRPPPPGRPLHATTLPLPASLVPGAAVRAQNDVLNTVESALFFKGNASGSPVPPPGASSGTHARSNDIPSYTSNQYPSKPTLPPKPPMWMNAQESLYPQAVNLAPKARPKFLLSPLEDVKSVLPTERSSSPDEGNDQDLARTLELSLLESGPSAQSEDEILARVLEESLATVSASRTERESIAHGEQDVRPSTSNNEYSELQPSCAYNPDASNIDLEELEKKDQARQKQLELDEAFARKLVLEEVSKLVLPTNTSSKQRREPAPSAPPSLHAPFPQHPADDMSLPPPTYESTLPRRQKTASVLPSASSSSLRSNADSRNVATARTSSPLHLMNPLGRSVSAQAVLNTSTSLGQGTKGITAIPPVLHNGTTPFEYAASVPNTRSSGVLGEPVTSQSLDSPPLPSTNIHEDRAPERSRGVDDNIPSTNQSRGGNGGPLLHSSFVEEELLIGVSLGFNAPTLFPKNEPMQGLIPDIITLPYGKCPPLHIQAPSWKHLLKLMTRLSESKLVPAIEAVADTKREPRLRTVMQFIKLHQSANDWRTIVYLSIDIPVPADSPNTHRYTNGDVSVLPYSYQSSPALPGTLRAGTNDSDVSKWFTVPSTQNNPYPALPIALPDFAMYLHAVLEDSRRAPNDASGGLRRFAKLVDTLYPANSNTSDALGSESASERRTVGGFFRRALGRSDRSSQQRGGNSDTYEFITPFRIDEYQ